MSRKKRTKFGNSPFPPPDMELRNLKRKMEQAQAVEMQKQVFLNNRVLDLMLAIYAGMVLDQPEPRQAVSYDEKRRLAELAKQEAESWAQALFEVLGVIKPQDSTEEANPQQNPEAKEEDSPIILSGQ